MRWHPNRDGRGYSAFGAASRTLIVDGYRGELLVDPGGTAARNQRLISEEIGSAVWRKMT
ncbi:hypothetical protein ACNKHV_17740 [Shigella flexneri]